MAFTGVSPLLSFLWRPMLWNFHDFLGETPISQATMVIRSQNIHIYIYFIKRHSHQSGQVLTYVSPKPCIYTEEVTGTIRVCNMMQHILSKLRSTEAQTVSDRLRQNETKALYSARSSGDRLNRTWQGQQLTSWVCLDNNRG